MLGAEVEYRIMDILNNNMDRDGDSKGGDGEVVDIVVHVMLRDQQLGQFKQIVHKLKSDNIVAGQHQHGTSKTINNDSK